MKETLLQFGEYNIWANKRLITALLKLDEKELDKDTGSSFPSIRKTVYHIWSAEAIWMQRLRLAEHPQWMETDFKGSFEEACKAWQEQSAELLDFISKQYEDRGLMHTIQYYNRKKQSFKNPVYLILLHCFNHSTFHRGQIVTMLRQAGVSRIPETDLIAFARKKGS